MGPELTSWIAIGISALSLLIAGLAERRARQAQLESAVQWTLLTERYGPGTRLTFINDGSVTFAEASIELRDFARVRLDGLLGASGWNIEPGMGLSVIVLPCEEEDLPEVVHIEWRRKGSLRSTVSTVTTRPWKQLLAQHPA